MPRTLLKMPGSVGTVVSAMAPSAALAALWATADSPGWGAGGRGASRAQASTQAPSWWARPSTSSRRRLTAATRTDHYRSLRSILRYGTCRQPSATSQASDHSTIGPSAGSLLKAADHREAACGGVARPRGGAPGSCGHIWQWCSALVGGSAAPAGEAGLWPELDDRRGEAEGHLTVPACWVDLEVVDVNPPGTGWKAAAA